MRSDSLACYSNGDTGFPSFGLVIPNPSPRGEILRTFFPVVGSLILIISSSLVCVVCGGGVVVCGVGVGAGSAKVGEVKNSTVIMVNNKTFIQVSPYKVRVCIQQP